MRRYFGGPHDLPSPGPTTSTTPPSSSAAASSSNSSLRSSSSRPTMRSLFLFNQPRRNSNEESIESDSTSANLAELSRMVEKALGPVGNPTDGLSVRIPSDRMAADLAAGTQQRHRLLRQFLRARECNPIEAMHMITSTLLWRKKVDIQSYLQHGRRNMIMPAACFPMHIISHPDTCKQPVVYGLIRLLDKKKADRSAFQNALLSFLEMVYFEHTYIMDEMIIILDFRDWSIRRNAPYRLVKDGIQTLQAHYPERLGRVFIVNYPTTIRAAYTAISPIIDAGAKEKIVWVPDADPSATLLKYVPAKAIPVFMGGELNADFPDAWPDVAAEFEQARANVSSGRFLH